MTHYNVFTMRIHNGLKLTIFVGLGFIFDSTTAFLTNSNAKNQAFFRNAKVQIPNKDITALNFFDKIFEESGPLGKGITVGKVQLSLLSSDRSSSSIFGMLEKSSRSSSSLAKLTNEVCLALLRKSDDWSGACSESKWFSQNDGGKAESLFNDWSNREAIKFEKEYIPSGENVEKGGGPTLVVVSLIIEIQGDSTKFDGAGFSRAGTKEVLSSIASDSMVDNGDCVNAVELFWTPSERDEVLSYQDALLDFPELVDL